MFNVSLYEGRMILLGLMAQCLIVGMADIAQLICHALLFILRLIDGVKQLILGALIVRLLSLSKAFLRLAEVFLEHGRL